MSNTLPSKTGTLKATSPDEIEIYIILVYFGPGYIKMYTKHGRNDYVDDYVGVMPKSGLENLVRQNWKLEKWPESDKVFNDFPRKIIPDIFQELS